jgi:hypothetical protein
LLRRHIHLYWGCFPAIIVEILDKEWYSVQSNLPVNFIFMKITYILIASTCLLASSCKKEAKEIITDQSEVFVNPLNPCFGNTWSETGDFTAGLEFLRLIYNNKLYVFRSQSGPGAPEGLHIYDGTNWQIIPMDIPITSNLPSAFGFTIGNKGYIGISQGAAGSFYEFDFAANSFIPKALYPVAQEVRNTATFAVGNKGYVMGGYYWQNGTIYNKNDTYEYNPASNAWTQKSDFAWLGMSYSTGFAIGNKGYLINGKFTLISGDVYTPFFREYNPVSDTWTSKSAFPGDPRVSTNLFVISGSAYAGGGSSKLSGSPVEYKDFYKYNPVADAWTQIADFPITTKLHYSAFSINSRGYVTYNNLFTPDKIVKYTPLTCFSGSPGIAP